jgi:phosphoesterase RecJ-like protein
MTEWREAADFLKRTEKFIITCHETPDGDAIGSECAMLRALRGLKKRAIVLNADPMPKKFAYIDIGGDIAVLSNEGQLPPDLGSWSLLMLDTNDVNNIGQISSLVLPRVKEYFIIDHHENEGDLVAGNFIQKSASSTAEILFQLFREMGIQIDFPIAQALYTAIVYDTGSFIYPKTTALTFEIARDLVTHGVEPNLVYSHIYESNSISALVLQSRVLATLELVYGSAVAILTMRKEMIAESGAIYEEADQLINVPCAARTSVFPSFSRKISRDCCVARCAPREI